MPAELIDGRAIAKKVRAEVAERAKKLAQGGLRPGLAVVMVGDDPASAVYTSAKAKAAEEAGMSCSAWLSAAAERRLRQREGLRGVEEWEAEAGVLSPEERAAGEALLDRLLGIGRRTRSA